MPKTTPAMMCSFRPSRDWGIKLICFALILLVAGCKEEFVSPAPPVVTGYLVIEGVINNGGGLTNIRLSRTTSLNDNNIYPESGAVVMLADNNNNITMQLPESNTGNYSIDNLHLDTTKKYQLSIKTSNNEEYLSDSVSVRNNPPIDSINWVRDNDGVNLFINTHDPQNNTRYYQWEFNETWEFHSAFNTILKYIGSNGIFTGVEYRDASDPLVWACWQNYASPMILLGSSAKLSQDIIHLPLTNVPTASWKISVLYSLLVKQYSWSKEGYEFLDRMRKNTESVGSVFDPQPSELNSNFHCITNPDRQVIGFFNICTIREKRIFIKNSELPNWGYRDGCRLDSIENNPDSIARKGVGMLPTTPYNMAPYGVILSFWASKVDCVDCTVKGTNIKPTFWP